MFYPPVLLSTPIVLCKACKSDDYDVVGNSKKLKLFRENKIVLTHKL